MNIKKFTKKYKELNDYELLYNSISYNHFGSMYYWINNRFVLSSIENLFLLMIVSNNRTEIIKLLIDKLDESRLNKINNLL